MRSLIKSYNSVDYMLKGWKNSHHEIQTFFQLSHSLARSSDGSWMAAEFRAQEEFPIQFLCLFSHKMKIQKKLQSSIILLIRILFIFFNSPERENIFSVTFFPPSVEWARNDQPNESLERGEKKLWIFHSSDEKTKALLL